MSSLYYFFTVKTPSKNSTSTYNSDSKTAGYTLSSDGKSIKYSAAQAATALATINGIKSTDGIKFSGKTIKLTATGLSSNVSVSSDEYKFDFASGYKDAAISGTAYDDTIKTAGQRVTIDGGKGDDIITSSGKYTSIFGGSGSDSIVSSGSNSTINGGKGNDTLTGGKGKDIFVYAKGDGNDKITNYAEEDIIQINSDTVSKITPKNNDVVFTLSSKGKITITGGADKVISYSDKKGEQTYPELVKFNTNGKSVTLKSVYDKDSFNIANYDDYKNSVVTINASAVNHELNIIANKLGNKIIGTKENDTIDGGAGADSILGGKGGDSLFGGTGDDTLEGGAGNDILTGGKGADVFVYTKGDGNDKITDYDEDDKIQINSDTVSKTTAKNGDVIFTLASKGKITVMGGADKVISYSDKKGEHTYPESVKFNTAGTKATLTKNYTKDSFDIANYSEYKNSVVTIDASDVKRTLNITANKQSTKIIGTGQDDYIKGNKGADTLSGGAGNDTLEGGKGNDNLTGGKGSDIFIYNNGDGNDVIADFTNEDKIVIASGKVGKISTKNSDVIFKIGSKGKITVKNAADMDIPLYDASLAPLNAHYSPFIENDEEVLIVNNNSLSSIVEDKSYAALSDTALNLSTNKSYVPVIAQSNKK